MSLRPLLFVKLSPDFYPACRPRAGAFAYGLALLCTSLTATGCKHAPLKPETHAERVEKEARVGSELSQQLEGKLRFRHDAEVEVYLRNLAKRLARQSPELGDSAVGVLIVDDVGRRWQDFSLPGNRIYLSDRLLKTFDFENEVAAALALEIGHLERGHVLAHLKRKANEAEGPAAQVTGDSAPLDGLLSAQPGQRAPSIEFFGPAGVFAFQDKEQQEAIAGAIRVLYGEGIDPRGVVNIWKTLAEEAASRKIAYDTDSLAKYEEMTRLEISSFPPLRNPLVKSTAFNAIRKRILAL